MAQRSRHALHFLSLLAISVVSASAQTPDPAAVWRELHQPKLSPNRSANVSQLTLTRDRIRLTLVQGAIQFLEPVAGVVYGAEFRGSGRVQIEPPNPVEAQQLRLLAKQDRLDLEFDDAVFVFTDGTFDEIAAKVNWVPATAPGAAAFYLERQNTREEIGAELLPRLYKGVLFADRQRSAIFFCELKTRDRGWIEVRLDALDVEEIRVGRWVKWIRTTNFETWMQFPAGGRGPVEAYGDPLAREDILVRRYVIDAELAPGEELRATARVHIEPRIPGERVLLFEFDSNLRVAEVKDGSGAALAFFQPRDPGNRDQSYGNYLAVALLKPSQLGREEVIEVRYAGKRVVWKVGTDNFFCQSYGWYPARSGSFASRSDFEMTFRYPKKYSLVATGSKIREGAEGETASSQWKSDIPLAVAGFAYGDYKQISEKSGEVTVEIYANRQPDDFMQGLKNFLDNPVPGNPDVRVLFATVGTLSPATMVKTMSIETGNMLRLFEKYFGPYPFKHLAVTNIPYSYGQGWPGLIYLSALSFLDNTQREAMGLGRYSRELSDFFRAHEVSHQWWGHRVGWKSYHDQWLSEGFAQFSGNLYVHFRQGSEKEYLKRLRLDKQNLLVTDKKGRTYESLGPVWMGRRLRTFDSPGAYDTIAYEKGGLILHMLRMMFFDPSNQQNPDHRFIAMMQEFCKTFDNKPASTEDFKAVVEKHLLPVMNVEGNGKMDWFFRQYVYSTGIPQYQLRVSSQTLPDGKVKVSGTITQSGVPEGWKDILPIYMHPQGRPMLLGWTRVTQRENKLEFTLPFNPGKLQLNVYEDILADIKQ